MRTTLPFLALFAFLLGCQSERTMDAPESSTTTLSARVLLSATLDSSVYKSADSVEVRLIAGSNYDVTDRFPFFRRSCEFTNVPVGVSYSLSFRGFKTNGSTVWNGNTNGNTNGSNPTGTIANVTVAPPVTATPSDTTLSSLVIDGQTINLVPGDSTYDLTVAYTTMKVTAVATSKGMGASVTCNGGSCTEIPLTLVNPGPINIKVTNKNSSLTYVITVFRQTANPTPRDSTLRTLTTSPGRLYPDFNRFTTEYTDTVASDVTTITLNPTAYVPSDLRTSDAITCNELSCSAVDVRQNGKVIDIKVTNQNGRSLSYKVTVWHKAAIIDPGTPRKEDFSIVGEVVIDRPDHAFLIRRNTTYYCDNSTRMPFPFSDTTSVSLQKENGIDIAINDRSDTALISNQPSLVTEKSTRYGSGNGFDGTWIWGYTSTPFSGTAQKTLVEYIRPMDSSWAVISGSTMTQHFYGYHIRPTTQSYAELFYSNHSAFGVTLSNDSTVKITSPLSTESISFTVSMENSEPVLTWSNSWNKLTYKEYWSGPRQCPDIVPDWLYNYTRYGTSPTAARSPAPQTLPTTLPVLPRRLFP